VPRHQKQRAVTPIARIIGRSAVSIAAGLLLAAGLTGCGHRAASTRTTTAARPAAATAATTARTPQPGPAGAARETYVKKMRALGQSLGLYIQNIGQANDAAIENAGDTTTIATLIARNLTHLRTRLRKAATALAAITPPANVRASHAALRRAVLEYAAELTRVIGLARTGNYTAVRQIGSLEGVKKMERASAAITRKGYAIVSS
jgi:hypothetical protein